MKYSIDHEFQHKITNSDDLIYFSDFRIARTEGNLDVNSTDLTNVDGTFNSIYKDGILNINIQIDPNSHFNFSKSDTGGGYFKYLQLYYRVNKKDSERKLGIQLYREDLNIDPPFYWNTLINLPITIKNPNIVLEKDEMTALLEGSGLSKGGLPKYPKEKFRDLWKEKHTSNLISEFSFINRFGLRTY